MTFLSRLGNRLQNLAEIARQQPPPPKPREQEQPAARGPTPMQQALTRDGFESAPVRSYNSLQPPMPLPLPAKTGVVPGGEYNVKGDGSRQTVFKLESPPFAAETGPGSRITGKIEGGPFSNGSVSIQRGPPGANGRIPVTVEITRDTGVKGTVTVGTPLNNGQVGSSVAQRDQTSYKLNLTPEELQAIERGEKPLPTMEDPTSIPVGGSIVVSSDQVNTGTMSGTLRGIKSQQEQESSSGVALSVERLDEKKVRLTVGPQDKVTKKVEMGPSVQLADQEFKAVVTAEEQASRSKTQSVEVDLSTPEGRAAYEQFMKTGQLPAANPPGVDNPQSIETLNYKHAAGVAVQAGPFKAGVELGDTNGQLTATTGKNGTQYVYQGDARAPNSINIAWTEQPDGTPNFEAVEMKIDNRKMGDNGFFDWLTGMGEVRPADQLLKLAGQPTGSDNVSIKMTGEGMENLQLAAIRHTREKMNQLPNHPLNQPGLSDQEWAEQAREYLKSNSGLPYTDPVTVQLIEAKGQKALARTLASNGVLDQASGRLAQTLIEYTITTPDLLQGKGIEIKGAQ